MVPAQAKTRTPMAMLRWIFPELHGDAAGDPKDGSALFGIRFVAIYIIAKMFYVFNVGSAQPADIMLAALAILVTSPQILFEFFLQNKLVLLFIVWVSLVQVGWVMITGKLNMSYFILFYAFNLIIMIAIFALRKKMAITFDRWILIATKLAILMQFIATLLSGSGRAYGTFLNPNQLAYWGVLNISILIVLKRNKLKLADYPFILLAIYCVVASLSRGGVVGVGLLLLVWGWFALRTLFRRMVGAVVLGAMIVAVFGTGLSSRLADDDDVGGRFASRVQQKESTNPLAGRNYERIVNFPEYLLLGAGEGAYGRFGESWGAEQAIEIHSTFATLLFCYGVIGFILFFGFIGGVMMRSSLELGLYLLPALAYSVTHQGMRFSYFWILVAILCSIADERLAKAKIPPRIRPPLQRSVRRDRSPQALRRLIDRRD